MTAVPVLLTLVGYLDAAPPRRHRWDHRPFRLIASPIEDITDESLSHCTPCGRSPLRHPDGPAAR